MFSLDAVSPAPRPERRRVSALLVEPCCSEARLGEPEALLEPLLALLPRVEAIAERYGGRLDRLLDPAILVVFGADEPHEDDPERAVRTALDLLGEADPAATLRAILQQGTDLRGRYVIEDEAELPWALRRDARSAVTYCIHYVRARRM